MTARLEPAEAYGEWREELVFKVPIGQVQPGLRVGDNVRSSEGASAIVTAVTETTVAVDANHPLAGEALTFETEMVSIE